jgi:4-hydroxy-2-oxoheptanedioate aldolase
MRKIKILSVSAAMLVWSMAGPVTHGQQNLPRYMHTMLDLLEQGKIVFAGLDYTFVDMEHNPFDVTQLKEIVQFNVDPEAIRNGKPVKTILVRIPAYGRELDKNHWQVKQVLDAGVHGIVFPTIESTEQVMTALTAMRYPQKPGVKDADPAGLRGTAPGFASRVWGLSQPEYIEKADIWKLDPGGQLIPWFLIESPGGVAAARDICRLFKEKNIGGVLWLGTGGGGDMLNTHGGDRQRVDRAVDTVLAAGKEFGCTIAMVGNANITKRISQGARLFSGTPTPADLKEAGR